MAYESLLIDAEGYIKAHGPITVAAVIFLESFGAPLPGESLLVVSGALAARGEISMIGLAVWAWVGAVAGDSVGYWIGRRFGRSLILRYGGRIGMTPARFEKVESVFARFGPVAVVFARFFDILRQLNGLVAGTAGMAWPRFLVLNAIGGFLWVGTWGFGAYYLADHTAGVRNLVRHLGHWQGTVLAIVLLVAVALLAGLAWKSRSSRRRTTV
ncbi:DedA family protein [Microbaculum marinum]|uniref:DedA family protein n=1 Tax=Microbaculum marinum TaxID=1764581 RepID=A0AAW9RQC5_9HYPH